MLGDHPIYPVLLAADMARVADPGGNALAIMQRRR